MTQFVQRVQQAYGTVHLLVLNAGGLRLGIGLGVCHGTERSCIHRVHDCVLMARHAVPGPCQPGGPGAHACASRILSAANWVLDGTALLQGATSTAIW